MTPEFGAAVAAREDRHARLRRRGGDQQVRAPRRRGRAARRAPPAGPQPRGVRRRPERAAGVRHHRGALQRRRRHRALPAPARRCSPSAGSPVGDGHARRRSTRTASDADRVDRAAGARAATSPRSPTTVRGYHAATDAQAAAVARRRQPARRRGRARPTQGRDTAERRRGARPLALAAARRRRRAAQLLDGWPAQVDELAGDTDASGAPLPRVAVGHRSCPGSRCPRFDDHGELLRWLRAENLPGPLPVHRRRVPVQARRRGPGPHVRRRGRRRSAPTGASTCSPRASPPPACRPRSTRSRSTASTPTSAPTSTARSATPACRSPRSTT